jgi:hypothetical protein
MAVQLITPFTQVLRQSILVANGVVPVSGTWVSQNAAFQAILPAAAGQGYCSLVLEGLKKPSETATFDGNNVPSELVPLPSAVAANAIAVCYGVFDFKVGPEGYETAVETASPGALLYVATSGKLSLTAGAGVAVAVVRSASATELTARTLAAG